MTLVQFKTLMEWFEAAPLFFNSKLFRNYCLSRYGIDCINQALPIDTLDKFLRPFIMFPPSKLRGIIIFNGTVEDDDTSGLGVGMHQSKKPTNVVDIDDDRLRKFILKFYPHLSEYSYIGNVDISLNTLAKSGILLLNEFWVDSHWGYIKTIDVSERVENMIILRKLLEVFNLIDDSTPIALDSYELKYIEEYAINTNQIYYLPRDLKKFENIMNKRSTRQLKLEI